MKKCHFLQFLFVSFVLLATTSKVYSISNNKITGNIEIDAINNKVKVQIEYTYIVSQKTEQRLFYLNNKTKNLKCSISKDGSDFSFKANPKSMLAGLTKDLVIDFNKPLTKGELVKFKLDYVIEGLIDNKEWIELYVEKFWIPLETSFGTTFGYEFELNAPTDYKVVAAGTQKKTSKGAFKIKSLNNSMIDIPLVLNKNFNYKSSSKTKTSIYTTTNLEYDNNVLEWSDHILRFYKKNLGKVSNNPELKVIIRPKSIQANPYARPGYIIINQDNSFLENKEHHYKVLAHEIAHLWWSKAHPMKYAWLNESMAEYSAILALSNVFGTDKKNKMIASYDSQTQKMKSIKKGNPLSDGVLLYRKGPVILNKLEKEIGEKKVMKFMRKLHSQKIKTTEGFLDLLGSMYGSETKLEFENKLNN